MKCYGSSVRLGVLKWIAVLMTIMVAVLAMPFDGVVSAGYCKV